MGFPNTDLVKGIAHLYEIQYSWNEYLVQTSETAETNSEDQPQGPGLYAISWSSAFYSFSKHTRMDQNMRLVNQGRTHCKLRYSINKDI